ncbi:hypothetical protein RUM44_007408 [Polyplax serrata]|uniref:Uncharacterized protein n=1 Tax=Polyplax serrata TaxID=468196 RepID=A0ABR1B0L0_POLSC
MVKCPRGTPAQIKVNLLHSVKPEASDNTIEENEKEVSDISEEFELDSNRADKRRILTPQEDLVHFFFGCILDVLVESWDGKPCYRMKLSEPPDITPCFSEEFGEDLTVPCEDSSTLSNTLSVDYLTGLYKKRSVTLSKEKPSENIKPTTKSETNESEEYEELGGEDVYRSDFSDTMKSTPDEEINLVFTNGVWYKGRVSRKLMDGEGTYFWQDGTFYKVISCMLDIVYEGDVYKGFRHGEGLHCLYNSPIMYTGQWWLGKKHGEGLLVYNEPSKGNNFYRGQWESGVKEGFGYRQYPSGAKYVGYWSNGKRHGKGVMLWNNNDIYRGQWKNGVMHGYGEYTWNSFVNKTLSYPAANTYRGYWVEGKRHGNGVFETMDGAVINTVWECDMKTGPGQVMCANGTIIAAESLFRNDKQASFNLEDDSTGLLLRQQNRPSRDKYEKHSASHVANMVKTKSISIPIHSSICSINLTRHVQKLNKVQEIYWEKDLKPYPQFPMTPGKHELGLKMLPEFETEVSDGNLKVFPNCCHFADEEKYLRNVITSKIARLKAFYDEYATMACEKSPPFKCLLLRFFLWQILIESKIVNSNRSLIDIDNILVREDYLMFQSAHDPFEPIRLGQFIHILVILSWHLYGQYVFKNTLLVTEDKISKFLEVIEKSESKLVLKTAFDFFLENDIFPASSNATGEKVFFDSDLAPMEAMYATYRQIGEPHTARVFISKICRKKCDQTKPPQYLPHHIIGGKNALTVAGELTYIPEPLPFNFPEIPNFIENRFLEPQTDFLFTSGLSTKQVVECLARACPGFVSEGCLVNMDHELTFLEFYRAIIFCTELALKMTTMKALREKILEEHKRKMDEFERRLSEQEKLKESLTVSGKRSRQVTDIPRAGKK